MYAMYIIYCWWAYILFNLIQISIIVTWNKKKRQHLYTPMYKQRATQKGIGKEETRWKLNSKYTLPKWNEYMHFESSICFCEHLLQTSDLMYLWILSETLVRHITYRLGYERTLIAMAYFNLGYTYTRFEMHVFESFGWACCNCEKLHDDKNNNNIGKIYGKTTR